MKNTTLAVVIMAVAVFAFLNMAKKRQKQNMANAQKVIATATPIQQAETVEEVEETDDVTEGAVSVAKEEKRSRRRKIINNKKTVEPELVEANKNSDPVEKGPPEKGLYCDIEENEDRGKVIALYLDGKGNYFFWLDAKKNTHFQLWKEGTAASSGLSPSSIGRYGVNGNSIVVDFYNPSEQKKVELEYEVTKSAGRYFEVIADKGEDTFLNKEICRKEFGPKPIFSSF